MTPEIFQACVVTIVGILTKYIISYLASRKQQIKINSDNILTKKYIDMIYDTVNKCVMATNQTYVDCLKKDNAFTPDAQARAFRKTYEAIVKTLSDEAKSFIESAMGDMETYITTLIEAQVKQNKG